jgi:hypothetical protein
MTTSQNGWPASANRADINIKSYAVPGCKTVIACADKAAPLIVAFMAEFHKLIEPIDEGQLDDWGYHFAFIPGSTDYSNHSSGTAIDINATKHPWGKIGTFEPGKVPMIQALAKKYGLRWGGDYHGKKDEMHYEVILDPIKAAALIKSLGLEASHI